MDAISLVSFSHPWYLRMSVSDLCNQTLKYFSKTFTHSVSFSLEYSGSTCLILWCWMSWLVSLSPWPHYMMTWFYFLAIWEKKIFILNFAAFTNSLWKPLSDFLEHYYVISFYKSRLCFFFLRFWSSLSFLYRYFSSGVLSQGHTCACFQSSLPSIFLLIVLLFPLYLWVITFFHCCDKVPNKSNCRKEGSVWVHFLKLRYIVASWQEGTVAGARGGWILSLRQVGSSIKKSQEINSRTWNPFILFIQAKDLRAWTGVGQTDSDLTLATYVMGHLTSCNLI